MRAVVIDRFGMPGTLRDVRLPEPGPREVLVRETVAAVNPVDWKTRAGKSGERPMPLTLGQDFAGRVERVGAAVDSYAVGDRVCGTSRRHGAFADYTLVSLDDEHLAFAPIPSGVSDDIAAAIPTPALTALASLDILDQPVGSTIVIAGAAGSLGATALQLAKKRGLRAIAVVKGEQSEAARSFGADEVVDGDGDVPASILESSPSGVGAVLDAVASDRQGLERWVSVLVRGGGLVSTNHAADEAWFDARGIRAKNVVLFQTPQSSRASLAALLEAVRTGDVRIELGERGGLEQAAEFLDRGEHHTLRGKALILID